MNDEKVGPHPVDEDPESFIGPEINDPWNDPEQTDWAVVKEVTP